jgi:hypothetical protein
VQVTRTPIIVKAVRCDGGGVLQRDGSKGAVVEYVIALIVVVLFLGWLLIGVDLRTCFEEKSNKRERHLADEHAGGAAATRSARSHGRPAA